MSEEKRKVLRGRKALLYFAFGIPLLVILATIVYLPFFSFLVPLSIGGGVFLIFLGVVLALVVMGYFYAMDDRIK